MVYEGNCYTSLKQPSHNVMADKIYKKNKTENKHNAAFKYIELAIYSIKLVMRTIGMKVLRWHLKQVKIVMVQFGYNGGKDMNEYKQY